MKDKMMTEPIVLRVFEIVGSGLCVASDDGHKVYDQIADILKKGEKVELSFFNVESLTSAFLNTAIGQLYGEFTEEQIRAGLSVADMEQDDLFLLKRVVETAKEYFKNQKQFIEVQREVMGEDDDE